jgi:hypothetical protein
LWNDTSDAAIEEEISDFLKHDTVRNIVVSQNLIENMLFLTQGLMIDDLCSQ